MPAYCLGLLLSACTDQHLGFSATSKELAVSLEVRSLVLTFAMAPKLHLRGGHCAQPGSTPGSSLRAARRPVGGSPCPSPSCCWLSRARPFWLIVDEGKNRTGKANRDEEAWIAARSCHAGERWAGKARLSHLIVVDSTVPLEWTARLINGIRLDASSVSALESRPGAGVYIELDWRGRADRLTDYMVFLHLLDDEGNLVAQTDRALGRDTVSTEDTEGERASVEQHGVILPPGTPLGECHVNLGLYDAEGTRVPLAEGPPVSTEAAIDLGQIDVKGTSE